MDRLMLSGTTGYTRLNAGRQREAIRRAQNRSRERARKIMMQRHPQFRVARQEEKVKAREATE